LTKGCSPLYALPVENAEEKLKSVNKKFGSKEIELTGALPEL
jgi:hypothetical protein